MIEKYEYYKKFDWPSNPFTLTISPDLMVGYSSQIDSLLSHILNSHKVALIIGHTGSGKTTLLSWLNEFINKNTDNFRSFYIPKPPRTKKGLLLLFKLTLRYNILDRFRFKELNTMTLPKFLLKKTRNQKTVFLIDEAHESSCGVLEWLRTLNDMIPNILLIFAGLPTFEKKIETELPTLSMRVTTKAYLKSLNDVETESLIRKRIEKVGGKGLEPFTSDGVKKIYEISGGFPREIIKTCDRLIKEAAQKNIPTINKSFVEQVFKTAELVEPEEMSVSLSEKQKQIIELLSKKPKLTPTEIVDNLNVTGYKNKNNAIRSVNNILRRLMRDELVERKRSGNAYVYSLSGKTKSILTEA